MTEAATVPVLQSKLEALEREHSYLQMIRAKSKEAEEAKREWTRLKDGALEAKKSFDGLVADLQSLIDDGPPKPDPQQRLPLGDDEPAESPAVPAKPAAEAAPAEIPDDIAKLDLTDKQKQALAETGAKTLADLADLGNGNWPKYPKGFASVGGFGPKAVEKLVNQLPSTAPEVQAGKNEVPPDKVRVRLLTMAAASANLEVGDEYDATMLQDGSVVIQLPGQDATQFSPGEFSIVEASA